MKSSGEKARGRALARESSKEGTRKCVRAEMEREPDGLREEEAWIIIRKGRSSGSQGSQSGCVMLASIISCQLLLEGGLVNMRWDKMYDVVSIGMVL